MTIAEILGSTLGKIRALPSQLWLIEARMKGIECHPGVTFLGRPMMSRSDGAEIILHEGVRVCSAPRSNRLGCPQPSVLRAMASGARLELGKNVGISSAVICAGKSIVIGEGTIMGSGAMILDNDFHLPEGEWGWGNGYVQTARPVVVGRGVFIGGRAIVLKGVTIGDRAVIGAGAVVTRDVPPGMIAAGNPARILRPVSGT